MVRLPQGLSLREESCFSLGGLQIWGGISLLQYIIIFSMVHFSPHRSLDGPYYAPFTSVWSSVFSGIYWIHHIDFVLWQFCRDTVWIIGTSGSLGLLPPCGEVTLFSCLKWWMSCVLQMIDCPLLIKFCLFWSLLLKYYWNTENEIITTSNYYCLTTNMLQAFWKNCIKC